MNKKRSMAFLVLLLSAPLTAQTPLGKTEGRLVGSVGAVGTTPVVLYYEHDQTKIAIGTKVYGPYHHVWQMDWASDRSGVSWIATELDGNQYFNSYDLYADNRRAGPYGGVAYVRYVDGTWSYYALSRLRWVVVEDDRVSVPFDDFGTPVVSPDGSEYFRMAKKGNGWYFQDEDWYGPFEERPLIVFSRDSLKRAVATKSSGQWRVHGDDVWGPYDNVRDLTWSPDGTTLAWLATRDNETYVVKNGDERGPYQYVDGLQYSANGVLGYSATQDNTTAIYIGDHRSDDLGSIRAFQFVPGQDVPAYVFVKNSAWYVFDGKKSMGPYAQVGGMTFFPQGPLAAFAFRRGVNWYLWTPSQVQGPFDSIKKILVAPQGQSMAFLYEDHSDSFIATKGGRFGPYRKIYHQGYTSDGKHLTYDVDAALRGGEYRTSVRKIVIDNKEYTGAVVGDGVVYVDSGTIYLR